MIKSLAVGRLGPLLLPRGPCRTRRAGVRSPTSPVPGHRGPDPRSRRHRAYPNRRRRQGAEPVVWTVQPTCGPQPCIARACSGWRCGGLLARPDGGAELHWGTRCARSWTCCAMLAGRSGWPTPPALAARLLPGAWLRSETRGPRWDHRAGSAASTVGGACARSVGWTGACWVQGSFCVRSPHVRSQARQGLSRLRPAIRRRSATHPSKKMKNEP